MEHIYCCTVPSPIGELTLVSDGASLTWLAIAGQRFQPDLKQAEVNTELLVFKKVDEWIKEYFTGKRPAIDGLPLKLEGSLYQQMVWRRLLKIPYGETTSYGALAKEFATAEKKPCAQAVGMAVGRNPISIIIPCHRVIGINGGLVGYGGGLKLKRQLLDWENSTRNS